METNQIGNNSSKHLFKTTAQPTLEGDTQMDAESENDFSQSRMVGEGGSAPQDEELTASEVQGDGALLDDVQQDYLAEVDADGDSNHAEDGAGKEGTSSVSVEITDNSQWPFVRKPSAPPGSSRVEQ